jgi:hypothetical protein
MMAPAAADGAPDGPLADSPADFADLAARFEEGRDFAVTVLRRPSATAVVAVHGDPIERGVSRIARAIAGEDHNLYLFEGRLPDRNFERLHLASRWAWWGSNRRSLSWAWSHTVLARFSQPPAAPPHAHLAPE